MTRRDYMREYMRRYRDSTIGKPFLGVDGEGGDTDTGYHAYFLLRAGERYIVPSGSNIRLDTRECLDFLCSLPRDVIPVIFFGDYDVTKWLEDVPFEKLDRLVHRERRRRKDGHGYFAVDWGPYQFDYLPRKEFRVRRLLSPGNRVTETAEKEDDNSPVYGPWTIVSDVGPFFQTRFLNAIKLWGVGTPEQHDIIAAGKEARGTFTRQELAEIIRYNGEEIVLLQELMERFRDACDHVGYVPAKWQGPGQLAESMFSTNGVLPSKKSRQLSDARMAPVLEAGRAAFYGGRPEIMAVGPVTRPVFQFDINSAYPYALTKVPCLEHGIWRRYDFPLGAMPDARTCTDWDYALVYGGFHGEPCNNGKRSPFWYGIPFRESDGTIVYPACGRGWYWAHEVRSAIHQKFEVEQAWVYTRTCTCQPLGFVHEAYKRRLELGKDGPGIVLKLALNSMYGKTVQSIGSPKYSNPIWGSFITATCRALIQDFIHSSEWCRDPQRHCGQDILMIATDSVATWNRREDIRLSTELGGWSIEEHPRGMFLIQPGLYFGSSGKAAKTRGVPQSAITSLEDTFRHNFHRMVQSRNLNDGDVRVPQVMFVGLKLAVHRRNMKQLGQWIEFVDEDGNRGKRICFDWMSKRMQFPIIEPIDGLTTYIQTFPRRGNGLTESTPYSKNIGGLLDREESRIGVLEQPDWIPQIECTEMRY